MKTVFYILLLSASFLSCAHAKPIEIDTENAHIVVVRPIDIWYADNSYSEKTLESIQKKRVSYKFMDETGKLRYMGSPNYFQKMADTPITNEVSEELKKLNIELVSNDVYDFTLQKPITIINDQLENFVKLQNGLFNHFVIKQGDPSTLSGRVGVKKFLGTAGSLLTLGVAGKLGGANAAEAMLGSGITDDVYKASFQMHGAIAPVELKNVFLSNAGQYKQIDVRRVTVVIPEIVGQVIIAYKNGKTPEAENEAMVKAIISLTGADTNGDEVEQSRKQDLMNRQTIWDTCVAQGKPNCKS